MQVQECDTLVQTHTPDWQVSIGPSESVAKLGRRVTGIQKRLLAFTQQAHAFVCQPDVYGRDLPHMLIATAAHLMA